MQAYRSHSKEINIDFSSKQFLRQEPSVPRNDRSVLSKRYAKRNQTFAMLYWQEIGTQIYTRRVCPFKSRYFCEAGPSPSVLGSYQVVQLE